MDRTEREWVDGLRRADPAAFDAVFDAYRGPVWGFLVRLTRRTELAEELLQETFLRLAAHGVRLRPDTRLRPWLFTVARNLYRSHRRWAWLDGQRLAELAARAFGQTPTPHDHAAAAETGRTVEEVLAGLSDANREVALLVLIERLEPAEAAEVLGLSPEAVRQRLTRVRASIATAVARGAA